MSNYCRKTPPNIARRLRQEANFGCALCGCPVLENAHIIPFSVSHDFLPEDMVALCPTCHTKADTGKYPESVLRDAKKNPHNKNTAGDEFLVTGKDLIVNLGGYKAINTTRILVVDDFDIASIRRSDGNYLSLDINFFDMLGNFVGVIMDNKWTIDTRYFWDVEYKSQHLIVRSKPRKILFDLKIENEEVFLTGNMYYINTPIIMTRDMISIGGIEMARLTIKDARVGINFHNRSR